MKKYNIKTVLTVKAKSKFEAKRKILSMVNERLRDDDRLRCWGWVKEYKQAGERVTK